MIPGLSDNPPARAESPELTLLTTLKTYKLAVYRDAYGRLQCSGAGFEDERLAIKVLWQLHHKGLVSKARMARSHTNKAYLRFPKTYTVYSLTDQGRKLMESDDD